MNSIKCIITDDEPLARRGLQTYVEQISFLQLVTSCEDALQLREVLAQETIDLVFLDIEMPFISGIEFLKTLKHPPKVIFTTAYENYALQGFELDVLDYLLKPISFERFARAAGKAFDYFSSVQSRSRDYFFIKCDGRLEKVLFGDIIFIEAMENYVAVHTSLRRFITHATLKSMHLQLPSHFIQTHKSYIVNPIHVTAVEANQLYCDAFKVPVSKYQKEKVMETILNNRLLKKE